MHSEEIKNLRRKLKKARDNGKLQEISDCCCNLAAYLSEEHHEEALKLYKESLRACEILENKEGVALANRMIAEECTNLGYFDDALKHVTLFLKYAEDEGNKVEEQRGLVLKGHVYFTHAEYLTNAKCKDSKRVEGLLDQSMEAYRKSFAICTSELNDINEKERLQMKARLLQNKSLVLSRQNKLDYAQAHLIRAIKICAKEKFNDTEHICYLSLGDLYIKKGEPEKAVNVYDKVFEMSHSKSYKRDALIGKANTFIIMENYEKAKNVLKKAYKLKPDDEEIKKLLKQVATVLKLENNLCSIPDNKLKTRKDLFKKLGDTYCALKNYKKGIRNYLNMLTCTQKIDQNKNDLINCYILLCKAFTNDKQYDKALFYSHQEIESLSKWAPEKACKTFLRIGKLHELNNSDFEEILFAYVKAKNQAKKYESYRLQTKCLKHLIKLGNAFSKPDLIKESEEELKTLKMHRADSVSSCESDSDCESEITTDCDSEANSDQSSDINLEELISDSDVENEEFDRPKERCKRTMFKIKRNEKGETDLHVAAIKGNYKRVKLLLDQGHPVNVRDTAGWTPLHEACNHGYVDIVNILLDFGANINDKGGPSCDGTTPLHDAAINGQLEILETLIKRGASTIVLNDAGETPLQCLLAWKKKSALDAEEDLMFKKIVKALKSPLDSEDIKRHLVTNKLARRNSGELSSSKKNSTDMDTIDMKTYKPFKSTTRPQNTSPVSEYKKTIELLRRKHVTYNSDDEDSKSESSEEDDAFGKLKRKSLNKRKAACNEYKKAIDDLRHKPKKFKGDSVKTAKPALIDEKEYIDNCILDNDDFDEREEIEISLIKEQENEAKNEYGVEEWINEFLEDDLSLSKSLPSPENIDKKRPSLEKECTSNPWLKDIPVNLLEDSFNMSSKQSDKDVVSSTTVCKESDLSDEVSSTPTAEFVHDNLKDSEMICLNVMLCNEKVKVSVKKSEIEKLKFDWLVKEIAKQHPAVGNYDYFTTLKVGEEVVVESDSLIKIINKDLELMVTKWKSLPLSQRYEKACEKMPHKDITTQVVRSCGYKHSPHSQVVDIFKNSLNSRCLSLTNLKLSSLSLIPICKALKYESFIQNLNLSLNYFGDKGIELIMKVFERCIIEELNVGGCSITSSGVYHFSDSLEEMNELSKNGLEILDLSNNPITDDAIEAINQIIDKLPNLRVLNLSHCKLESSVKTNNSSLNIIQSSNCVESNIQIKVETSC